jgi:transcriptional regulator with XRE-family HTH domain
MPTVQAQGDTGSLVTNTHREKFAADLDELRLLVGLTYRELARRTGCARSTLHDALTGRRFPRLDTVLPIVRACGGDVASWRERWAAAGRREPDTPPAIVHLAGLLGIGEEQIVRVVVTWRPAQDQGTAPSMSWQSTNPS